MTTDDMDRLEAIAAALRAAGQHATLAALERGEDIEAQIKRALKREVRSCAA